MKLVYLVSHPIQYQAPLLRRLAREPWVDLHVLFVSDFSVAGYFDQEFKTFVKWDVPLTEGYSHEFLSRSDANASKAKLAAKARARIRETKPDAFWVHGYADPLYLGAIHAAKRAGAKVMIRGESHIRSRKRAGLKSTVRDIALRQLLRRIDAALYIGTENRRYYESLGVEAQRLFPVPYAVDNQAFQTLSASAAQNRAAFRAKLNLDPKRPVILFAAKLMDRKRPHDLLKAFGQLENGNPYLLFVGDGELRPSLEAAAQPFGDSVRFIGFVGQRDIVPYYDLCDVFVLASETEPWGLAINEVMNSAKPVIVSDELGCAADLVKHGENGFIVKTGDTTALASALSQVLSDKALNQAMGQASLRRIQSWGFEQDVEGISAAVQAMNL